MQPDRVPSIGDRLENIETILGHIRAIGEQTFQQTVDLLSATHDQGDDLRAIRELLTRQAETDPMAILNAALKAEQEQGR